MSARYTQNAGKITLTTSATAASLILLQPGVSKVLVTEIGISLDGSAPSPSVRFDTYRVTTLGSPVGTGGTQTPIQEDVNDGPSSTSALINLTTEPTTKVLMRSWYIQPFGGLFVLQFPLGREPVLASNSHGGVGLGLQYTAANGVTCDCLCYIQFEE